MLIIALNFLVGGDIVGNLKNAPDGFCLDIGDKAVYLLTGMGDSAPFGEFKVVKLCEFLNYLGSMNTSESSESKKSKSSFSSMDLSTGFSVSVLLNCDCILLVELPIILSLSF